MRFYATGLLLAAGLLGAVMGWPNSLESLGVRLEPEACATGEVLVGPSEKCIALRKRCAAKARVIARLRAGDLTLFEAASWFRSLNRIPPGYADPHRDAFPGNTEEEKLCHQVICWMKSQMEVAGAPEDEIEQMIARLEADLADRLCEFGRIDLPPLSSGNR